MSVRIYNPMLTWTPGDLQIAVALCGEINNWANTPYESGQSFPQRGADCTGSVFGIIDALDGRQRMVPPGFPHDGALHDRPAAIKALREIIKRYTPAVKLQPGGDGKILVEPGDVVVTGSPGGGPGHVEIVGANPNELWHSQSGSGFHQGGWSFLESQILYAVYRIEDKWRWL